MVRDLPADCREKLTRQEACWFSAGCSWESAPHRWKASNKHGGLQHLGQGTRGPVLSAGHSLGWVMIRSSLVNGLRASHISVIIPSVKFEFLIIRLELK